MFYHYSALFVCNGRAVVAFSLSLVCLFEHAYELERNILICFFFFHCGSHCFLPESLFRDAFFCFPRREAREIESTVYFFFFQSSPLEVHESSYYINREFFFWYNECSLLMVF